MNIQLFVQSTYISYFALLNTYGDLLTVSKLISKNSKESALMAGADTVATKRTTSKILNIFFVWLTVCFPICLDSKIFLYIHLENIFDN
jgi:hypothetical protein